MVTSPQRRYLSLSFASFAIFLTIMLVGMGVVFFSLLDARQTQLSMPTADPKSVKWYAQMTWLVFSLWCVLFLMFVWLAIRYAKARFRRQGDVHAASQDGPDAWRLSGQRLKLDERQLPDEDVSGDLRNPADDGPKS